MTICPHQDIIRQSIENIIFAIREIFAFQLRQESTTHQGIGNFLGRGLTFRMNKGLHQDSTNITLVVKGKTYKVISTVGKIKIMSLDTLKKSIQIIIRISKIIQLKHKVGIAGRINLILRSPIYIVTQYGGIVQPTSRFYCISPEGMDLDSLAIRRSRKHLN